MQAEGLVDVQQERVGDDAQPNIQLLDRDRPDLLSLRLGVATEARLGGWKQDLERIDALDVRCHGNDRDDPRPRRLAVALAASLLTMTAGRRLFASEPRAESRSTE